jgi:hypothetical protein
MFQTFLLAITAAAQAYSAWVRWQQQTEIDRIEDEIDKLASIGDAASKLRMERLSKRKQRKLEQIGTL